MRIRQNRGIKWRIFITSADSLRINDGDFVVAFEVVSVEGQEMCDLVHEHCGNGASIVSLFADDPMNYHESLPLGKDRVTVGHQHEKILEAC